VKKYVDPDIRQKEYTKLFRENKDYLWPFDRYKYIDDGGVYTERGLLKFGQCGKW